MNSTQKEMKEKVQNRDVVDVRSYTALVQNGKAQRGM